MYQLTTKSPSNKRVFCACLLSFVILISPIATLATPKLGSRSNTTKSLVNTAPPFAPSISATLTDSIGNDDGDSKIDPTDGNPGTTETIAYTATITNNGPDPATSVVFTATIDSHTTLVPGSEFTSPLAINDSYSSVGNMTLDSNSIGGSCAANTLWSVNCNDTLNGGALTHFGNSQATANGTTVNGTNTVTTTNNGTVLLRTNGTFVYNSAAGFEGTDTFWYTLTNTAADPDLADNAQVSIIVGGVNGMAWFINNNAGAGTGRQANPFNTLAAFNSVNNGSGSNPNDGDTIFLFESATAYVGPVTLRSGQKFIGQDATVAVNTLGGPVAQPGNTYPGINPTGTTVNITSAGVGITLGSGNNIAGFSVGNSTTAITGGAVSTLNVRDVTINTNGAGLVLTTSGTIGNSGTFTGFTSITTTGGANGISLTGVGGTLNTTGSLSGASGSTFNVSGGTVSVTFSGNVTQANNAPLVSISGGHNTGTITFQTGTLSATNGTGLQFDNADSTSNFNGTTTLSGGDAGIDILNGSSGSFSFGSSTSISNPSGTAFNVNASAPTSLSYAGSITANSSRAVSISNAAAAGCGTQTYSGSINGSGASATGIIVNNCNGGTINFSGTTLTLSTQANNALTLTGNAGATINFSGGNQSLTTTNGHGINATGGGAVNITGNDNTINTTGSGSPVNWAMLTAVHSNGTLRFKSITKSGSGTKGIIVNFHDGSFTVTGDDDNNGTPDSLTAGGTITGTLARGAEFIDVDGGVSLGGMTFTNATTVDGTTAVDCGNAFQTAANKNCNAPIYFDIVTNATLHTVDVNGSVQTGIIGYNVNGLTMNSVTARNGGTTIDENGGAAFKNLSGNTSVVNSSFRDNTRAQFDITSTAGNMAGNITFLNNEFTGNRAPNLSAQGLLIVNGGTIGTVSVGDGTPANDNNFHDSFSNGIQYSGNPGATTATININRNSFTNTNSAVVLQVAGVGTASSLDYAIENNTIVAGALTGSGAIITSATQGHTLDGLIRSNTIGTSGVANSGAVCNSCNGITVDHDGFGRHDVSIIGNTVQRIKSIGIYYQVADASGNVVITGNLVREPEGNPSSGIFVQSGTLATDNGCVAVTMGGTNNAGFPSTAANAMNSVQGSWDPAGFQSEIFVWRRFATVLNLPGLSGGEIAWIAARNNIPDTTGADVTVSGTPFGNAASCPLMLQLDGVSQFFGPGFAFTNDFYKSENVTSGNQNSLTTSTPTTVVSSLRQEQLDLVVSAALQHWIATGLTNDQIATLRAIEFEISDLPGSYLGEAGGHRVVVDRDASGQGWFIDSSFNDRNYALWSSGALAGRVDLLTVIEHEMGHKLGLTDSYAAKDRDSLMYGYLTVGERRLPAHGQAAGARPTLKGSHFLMFQDGSPTVKKGGVRAKVVPKPRNAVVTSNVSSLPAGKSLTIQFKVTLNNPPNLTLLNPARVSTQGSVSYAESGTPILTDDPSVGGSANATETNADLFDTSTSLVSGLNPSNSGDQVTFTATVNETPTQASADPTGTVDFIDTSNGNAVICNDVALSAGSAQCQTSTLTAGTHNLRADYSGDGNFDPSQSNVVAQVVIACASNPVVTSTSDSGPNTLREALTNICNAPNNNVTFNLGAGPHTITVLSTLVIAKDVNITNVLSGSNGPLTISAGGGNFRVSRVASPVTSASISNLTVTGANATAINGGGLLVQSGTMTLTSVLFTGNTVSNGDGGALAVEGSATVNVRNSTISGNTARHAGGLFNAGGTFNLLNTTVSNNNANGNTGTGACPAGGSVNGAGGGIESGGNSTSLKNSIIAGNTACDAGTQNVSGAVTDQGNNLLTGAAGLAALADNGGPTQTHRLLGSSAALDAGDNTAATAAGLTTDQRGVGFPRIADSADANTTATVDIGAFELHPSIEDVGNQTTAEDTLKLVTFNLGDDTGALITSVAATSSNTALISNDLAHLSFSGSGGTRTLTITPNTDANSPVNGGTTTITITVTATNGQTTSDTFEVTVTEVNDSPDAVNDTLTAIPEDSGLRTIPFIDLTTNDSKGPANENGQTLTVTNVGNPVGGAVQINGANVEFTVTANFSGTASFDYTVTDNGTTNGVADPKSDTATASFSVNSLNDPPVNTVPLAQSTNQNTALTFSGGNGNQISIADADAASSNVQVTLTATNGASTLNGTAGLSFSFSDGNGTGAGDGTADPTMTFRGSITSINNALNGLVFTPTNGFSGTASLSIITNDLGNTGSGGPLTDTDSVNIQVSSNIRIQDAKVVEPPTGSTNMLFTVSLSAPAPASGVSVNFTTSEQPPAADHATAGQDYTTTSGAVTFAPGEQLKTVLVPVLSDNNTEINETFLVVLSNPVNGTITDDTATGTILIADQPGTFLVSELRTSGPAGVGDDFVELYNNSDTPLTIVASDASAGYGLFKRGADCNAMPVLIGTIPNGTVVPARGHYLFVGATYSLADYGGTGAAAGNATLTADIENDANVAIFTTADAGSISTATRLDAVGFGANTGGICDLLREGNVLPAVGPNVLEGSYQRDQCGKLANSNLFGACPTAGLTQDSNSNAQDFFWADTVATNTPAGQHLGAPGPENLSSPLLRNSLFAVLLVDATQALTVAPNRLRDFTVVPNGAFGTLTIRRRYRNDTGAPVTRLRFRIADISTSPVTAGVADMRALTSADVVVNTNDPQTCAAAALVAPCSITVSGTTVETPPSQPNGGANNSTLNVTLGTPLPNGASINIQWRMGLQSTGSFKFYVNVEALP